MISILIIFVLSFLPNRIYSTVTFTPNPGCNVLQCKDIDQPALYYGNQDIGEKRNHMIFSSFGELSVSIFPMGKTSSPSFNYTAYYAGDYVNAPLFPDVKPLNSFTLVVRRLLEFDDVDDKGSMDKNSKTTKSYFLSNLNRKNITFDQTNQPSFEYELEELGGSLKVDVVYPGESIRDTKFPKLKTEPSSFFLNIALKATNYSFAHSRFAFELYILSPSTDGYNTVKSRFIDDQYTPGSFNVWQLQAHQDTLYPSSMLWKPVVYLTEERSIEDNTLMQVYDVQNNVTRNQTIDQGVFLSLLRAPYVSGLNVSIGAASDGFFAKANYGFLQFTAGLDDLKPDATAQFVTIAVVVSFALPVLVGIIAAIFILKKRFSGRTPRNAYNEINN